MRKDFVANDELLLPILKTFAQCTCSRHNTLNASCFRSLYNLVLELSVTTTNSSPVASSAVSSPAPCQTRPPHAVIMSRSVISQLDIRESPPIYGSISFHYLVPKDSPLVLICTRSTLLIAVCAYEGWNFNNGNYLFTTDIK